MRKVEIEKRKCIRFELPGATLSYKLKKDNVLEDVYSEEFCPVADMSRGGLRFLSKIKPALGSDIVLKIAVPGEQIPLILKGKIRWVGIYGGPSYAGQIGVQLNPYGDENPDQNYPGTLVKIIALEQKFALPEAKEPL